MDTVLTPTHLNQDLGFVHKSVQMTAEYSSYRSHKKKKKTKN